MVNIRATLAAARRAGVIPGTLAEALTTIAKALFYKERTYDAVLQSAALGPPRQQSLRDFADWLPAGRVDQKRLDALAMLDAVRTHIAAGILPIEVRYELAETVAWQAAKRQAGERKRFNAGEVAGAVERPRRVRCNC